MYAIDLRLPRSVDRKTDLNNINRAYSEGVISFDQYEEARRFLRLRNEATHRFNAEITHADYSALRDMVDRTLSDMTDQS